MKTAILSAAMLFAAFTTTNAQSDKYKREIGVKTEQIKVSGHCIMDKKRIERAAWSVEGVKAVDWNESTQTLTLKYSVFKKTAASEVQRKIALAGNDTPLYKATDEVYNNLPACCKYPRKLQG